MASADTDLELRRFAAEGIPVREAVALGHRLQVICLCCNRRPLVDLRQLERRGFGDRRLKDLPFTCDSCRRRGRKMSIYPPGKDVSLRVLFVGERPTEPPRTS